MSPANKPDCQHYRQLHQCQQFSRLYRFGLSMYYMLTMNNVSVVSVFIDCGIIAARLGLGSVAMLVQVIQDFIIYKRVFMLIKINIAHISMDITLTIQKLSNAHFLFKFVFARLNSKLFIATYIEISQSVEQPWNMIHTFCERTGIRYSCDAIILTRNHNS